MNNGLGVPQVTLRLPESTFRAFAPCSLFYRWVSHLASTSYYGRLKQPTRQNLRVSPYQLDVPLKLFEFRVLRRFPGIPVERPEVKLNHFDVGGGGRRAPAAASKSGTDEGRPLRTRLSRLAYFSAVVTWRPAGTVGNARELAQAERAGTVAYKARRRQKAITRQVAACRELRSLCGSNSFSACRIFYEGQMNEALSETVSLETTDVKLAP